MGTRLRQGILLLSVAVSLFVGGWAGFAPHSFYSSFPGLTLTWVSVDGPFNEHLLRDVGALYLALAAAGGTALLLRSPAGSRVVGSAWLVFGVLHVAYHAQHLDVLATSLDAVGEVVSLTACLAFALLLLPPRDSSATSAVPRAGDQAAVSR